MANKGQGTNYFINNGDTGVQTALIDDDGNAVFVKSTTSNIPSAKAGYSIACLLMNLTTGSLFTNQGSTTSCTFRDVNIY